VTTLLGPVEIKEQVFQKASKTRRPLCERLKVRPGGYSRGLEKAVVDFGAEDSFELAAQRLRRHHPVSLCANTVRKITLEHARRIKQAGEKTGCLGALPRAGAKAIVAQADGTMLPVVEFTEASGKGDRRKTRKTRWMEMRLCAARQAGKADAVYDCDSQSVESLGYRWSHCAGKAGWGLNSDIHVVSDGASWIARQARTCFGSSVRHLLDLYHVMEYLGSAQKARAEWMKRSGRWLKVQKRRLLKGQYEKVIAELAPYVEAHGDDREAPIRAAWRYLSNHRDQLNYPKALADELPVGSGMIEGGHRHLLQKRLKLSGGWWSPSNLDNMASLRVCRANQQWDQYWSQAA